MKKLNRREKIAVGLTAAVLFGIAITEWVVLPIGERSKQLTRQVVSKGQSLREIQAMAVAYSEIKALGDLQQHRMKGREKGFTLFSYMDRLAGKADVKSRITYMRPSTVRKEEQNRRIDRVEMKIQGADMDHLVRFIHGIESGDSLIWIRRLTISKADGKQNGLNAVFQVETWSGEIEKGSLPAPGGSGKV